MGKKYNRTLLRFRNILKMIFALQKRCDSLIEAVDSFDNEIEYLRNDVRTNRSLINSPYLNTINTTDTVPPDTKSAYVQELESVLLELDANINFTGPVFPNTPLKFKNVESINDVFKRAASLTSRIAARR